MVDVIAKDCPTRTLITTAPQLMPTPGYLPWFEMMIDICAGKLLMLVPQTHDEFWSLVCHIARQMRPAETSQSEHAVV